MNVINGSSGKPVLNVLTPLFLIQVIPILNMEWSIPRSEVLDTQVEKEKGVSEH